MSKLGKKPIAIPKEAKVKVENGKLTLTGPKGSKELSINDKIFSATITDNNNLIIKLLKKNEKSLIIWGTTRSIINSALKGVTLGHEKILELSGAASDWGKHIISIGGDREILLEGLRDYVYSISGKTDITTEIQDYFKKNGYNFEIDDEEDEDW